MPPRRLPKKPPPKLSHRQVQALFRKAGLVPPKEAEGKDAWLIGSSYSYFVDEDGSVSFCHISGRWVDDRAEILELVEREIKARQKAFEESTAHTPTPAPRIVKWEHVGPYYCEQDRDGKWFADREAYGYSWRSGVYVTDGLPTREEAIQKVRDRIKDWALKIIQDLNEETKETV